MRSILIVDDEPNLVEGLYALFSEALGTDIDLCRAYSANDALVTLAETPVDLLITDIRMPGMSGLSLIERAAEMRPACRIIVLTGYEEFSAIHQATRHPSVDAFLLKNERDEVLLAAVDDSLDKIEQDQRRKREMAEEQRRSALFHALIRDRYLYSILGFLAGPADPPDEGFMLDPARAIYLVYARMTQPGSRLEGFAELNQNMAAEFGAFFAKESLLVSDADAVFLFQPSSPTLSDRFPFQTPAELTRFFRSGLHAVQNRGEREVSFVYHPLPLGVGELARHTEAMRTLIGAIIPRGGRLQVVDTSAGHLLRRGLGPIRPAHADDLLRIISRAIQDGDPAAYEDAFDHLFTKGVPNPHLAAHLLSLLLSEAEDLSLDALRDEALPYALSPDDGYQCLREAGRALCRERREDTVQSDRQTVERIHQHISENIGSRTLSLSSIAATIHYNPSYLSRFYKQETGNNLIDTINQQRYVMACALLRDTDIRVSEIGRRVGFASSSYFGMFFKKRSGQTPQEYRGGLIKGEKSKSSATQPTR